MMRFYVRIIQNNNPGKDMYLRYEELHGFAK